MKKMCDYIKKGLVGIYYYCLGHIIAWGHYDKAYLDGRWFAGKAHGLCAFGWRWVAKDYNGCRKLDVNRDIPWPVSPRQTIIGPENIHFHPDDLNNFQTPGSYFQGIGEITIGHGSYIAPNVGIITSNHNFFDLDIHNDPKPVHIGEKCWVGMNSVILPGVTLGNNTIVGAGSIVTKSFEDGYCVIAGNPAKIIKKLDYYKER